MKYLILLLILVGCTKEPERFKPVVILPNTAGGSITDGQVHLYKIRECIASVELGYIKDQVTFDRCAKHMSIPNFKIGQIFKIKDPMVEGVCKFTIEKLVWARGYVMNQPGYEGNVTCHKGNRITYTRTEKFFQDKDLK